MSFSFYILIGKIITCYDQQFFLKKEKGSAIQERSTFKYSKEEEEDIKARLRALGYI